MKFVLNGGIVYNSVLKFGVHWSIWAKTAKFCHIRRIFSKLVSLTNHCQRDPCYSRRRDGRGGWQIGEPLTRDWQDLEYPREFTNTL